jgi:predicted nicotinamide N-methyase
VKLCGILCELCLPALQLGWQVVNFFKMTIYSHSFKVLSLPIGKHTIQIAQIESPESLFDEFLNRSNDDVELTDERIPYWADLWPSAIALSEFISENENLVAGKKILEIGCGLGLAGIVAAKYGGNVMLTDYLPAALEFVAYNWKLNFTTEADTRLLDWRNPQGIPPVDVLLASDVAYESRAFKPLLKAIKTLVKKDGIVLISEPNRKFAKEFFDELKKEKYSFTESIKNVVKDGIENKISIYILKQDY